MTVKGNPPSVHDAIPALEPADVAPSGPDGGSRPRPHGNTRHSHRDRAEHPPHVAGSGQMFRIDRPVTALDGPHRVTKPPMG